MTGLLSYQWAGTLGGRLECFLCRNGSYDLVVVPRVLRLIWLLDANDIHVVGHAAVLADPAVLREEVIDRHLSHFFHDGVCLVSARRLDRLEVVHRCGIVGRLELRRHPLRLIEEPLRPSPRLIVHVPIEGGRHDHILSDLEPEAMDISDKEVKACQGLAALSQPELVGCLYRIDGSLTCGREADNLCLRGLCLEDVGRKVAGVGRMARRTQYLAAAGPDDLGRVLLNRMPPAKSMVTKYQESSPLLTKVVAVPLASA